MADNHATNLPMTITMLFDGVVVCRAKHRSGLAMERLKVRGRDGTGKHTSGMLTGMKLK